MGVSEERTGGMKGKEVEVGWGAEERKGGWRRTRGMRELVI
jgi:hypothetical protein